MLLRLGTERTTDEELQYKAALTVGTPPRTPPATMPPTAETHGTAAKNGLVRNRPGAAAMLQGRLPARARKGRESTLAYSYAPTAQDAARRARRKKGGC